MKEIKPTDLRRLKALVKDEHEASVLYEKMSRQFAALGMINESGMFAEMSSDESEHEKHVRILIKNIKELGPDNIY